MKIAVMTDVHANLPALRAALESIAQAGCDAIYHCGDAIAIGPYPAECLDLLLHTPNMRLIMGNHDAYFADGLPDPRPAWMSEGEVLHQHWTHAQLNPALREVVAAWPYAVQETFAGVRAVFSHYGLDATGRAFVPICREPSPRDLDNLFAAYLPADLVFYGHHHPFSDLTGQARYVNPGALGCNMQAEARFALLTCAADRYDLTFHAVPYDDTALFATLEDRAVPERDLICRIFLGGRHGRD